MRKDFKDIYQKITDTIIAQLEKGTPPWIQPWRYDVTESRTINTEIWPRNAITGHLYGGSNVLMCWVHLDIIGKTGELPLFLTFRQAKEAGGHVKKGEKGCPIIGFRSGTREVEEDDGTTVTKSFRAAFGHTVFHISQCEDVKLPKLTKIRKPIMLDLSHDKEWSTFLKATGATIKHGGNKAVYLPLQDEIHMPRAGQFKDNDTYKSVTCHELTHWTGHSKRLNRKLNNPKGDAQYAEEELIAELGAAFLCARLGIRHDTLRHASYIKSWLSVLKNDKRFIITASSQAMRAVEFIETQVADALKATKPKVV